MKHHPLVIQPPPPRTTLFPYTTLFRSLQGSIVEEGVDLGVEDLVRQGGRLGQVPRHQLDLAALEDRKSTRLNSSHGYTSYAVFCLKKENEQKPSAVFGRAGCPAKCRAT